MTKTFFAERSELKGEWGYIPGKTICKLGTELYTGAPVARGYERGMDLTPLTDDEKKYLNDRGLLSVLVKY